MKTKKHFYAIIIFLLLEASASAQVLISTNGGSPHTNALVDIKNPLKGVIFTQANTISTFPLFNAATDDLFDDSFLLEGALLYNKEDRQYYKYDGTVWLPALQLGGFHNPFETRRKAGGQKVGHASRFLVSTPVI